MVLAVVVGEIRLLILLIARWGSILAKNTISIRWKGYMFLARGNTDVKQNFPPAEDSYLRKTMQCHYLWRFAGVVWAKLKDYTRLVWYIVYTIVFSKIKSFIILVPLRRSV